VSAAQLALFSIEELPRPRARSRGFARYPQAPGFKARGASQEAARHVAASASRLRAQVLEELRRWPGGRTADEIANSLHRSPLSVRPQRRAPARREWHVHVGVEGGLAMGRDRRCRKGDRIERGRRLLDEEAQS
jgi:hypothetical protein